MKKVIFKTIPVLFPLITVLFFCTGCELLKEAWEADMEYSSSNPNSEDYRARFVIGIFNVVKYPRATELEREISRSDGSSVWINTNQRFDSKRIRDARAIPRPGNPDLCDLQFRLDNEGKNHWQMLVASARGNAVALMVDQRCVGTFVPEMPDSASDRITWVKLRIGVDPYTARGVVRFARSNHEHFNPEASDWFRF